MSLSSINIFSFFQMQAQHKTKGLQVSANEQQREKGALAPSAGRKTPNRYLAFKVF